MAFENLNFSNWTVGSENYSSGFKESETTKAKAKAAQMRGFESGLGTIIGAVVGGHFGGATGASVGGQIGGGLMSGDTRKATEGIKDLVPSGFSKKNKNVPKWISDLSQREKNDLAFDPMQYLSSMNAITGSDVIDASVAASKMYGGLI